MVLAAGSGLTATGPRSKCCLYERCELDDSFGDDVAIPPANNGDSYPEVCDQVVDGIDVDLRDVGAHEPSRSMNEWPGVVTQVASWS